MRKIYIPFIAVIMSIISNNGFGQEHGDSWHCSIAKRGHSAAKTTVADVAEDNYDVKYVKLNIAADNTTAFITGDVTTVAQAVSTSLSSYVFELNDTLTIDSVLIDGVNTAFTTSGNVCTVAFATPLSTGTTFTAEVFYHGTPVGSSTFFSPGLSNLTSPSWGNKVTSTLSESYKAKDWWPCKQSLTDKIDSSDVWITVPDSLKAGSNGTLQNVTTIDASHVRYEWKERYPIDYYLISIAVAAYVDYSYYMHFSGSTDSMLVQNYVYNNPATLPFFKNVIDSTGMMIDYFSQLYGRYPFWHEKYGHCMAPISGGMEHQTMTTLGFFESDIVAHELGHQWFGDNVTCGTWADIVMNEGFAGYTEYIYKDHFWNHVQATNDIKKRHEHVKSEPDGSVYVDDTTNENRIFDSRLTYDKGACVLHMLRFIISNDTSFFAIYRTYQNVFSNGNGTIADFKAVTEGMLGTVVNGVNLDTFFNQWFYLQGFPIYDVKWNQIGNDVYVKLDQTTSVPSSVANFTMPMEIKLRSATGDTIVRVVNDQPSQVFHFTWSKPTMYTVVMDPNSWLVDSVASIARDNNLAALQLSAPGVRIYPNPTQHNWVAEGMEPGNALELTDAAGRVLWSETATGKTETIPAESLSTGVYILRISNESKLIKTCKLLRN